jgi:hypothetical protein
MSGLSKYPPPPSSYADWKQWATQLTLYLAKSSDIKEPTNPQPIQLAHKLAATASNLGLERATTDGLMLYDPALGRVVISVGGVWKSLEWTP